jgi:formate dehydrogenase subunit gamma
MARVVHNESVRSRRAYHKRIMLWSLVVVLAASVLLPLTGYVYVSLVPAHAAAQEADNPRANYWRAVRDGDRGYTAVTGQETNVLIQNGGENWRQIRNGPVATYGSILMAAALLVFGLFHIILGPARLAEGRSGRKVLRWSVFERTMHWFVAILFIILAVTGLSLLYGRAVLIPLLGLQGFAAYAQVAKALHNYLGPAFIVGLVLMLAVWMRESFFRSYDWEWLKKGGGYIGKSHPHAGRVNAGEKIWFWVLFFAGLGVAVTGVFLNFPNYGFDRSTMQWSNVLHDSLGMLLIAFAFGHIYLGTIGNEGSFEGMWSGYVDENWAKQHHDVWYEEEVQGGQGGAQEPGQAQPKTSAT